MNDQPVRYALGLTLDGLYEVLAPLDVPGDQGPLSLAHARWMVRQCLDSVDVWPVDKTGRWIGWVQAIMAINGMLDVNEERDRTRPMFHEAYRLTGQLIPPTTDRD